MNLRIFFVAGILAAALGCSGSKSAATPASTPVSPSVSYTVTFVSGAGGSLQGTAAQTVAAGGNAAPVTAVPAAGHGFNGWSGQGAISKSLTLEVSNVTQDLSLTANFGGSAIGGTAADISGMDATGAACALSDYKGSVILLDLSTLWCVWCQTDAPELQALYATYQSQGLKVVTVLTENLSGVGPCSQLDLQNWTSAYHLTFRVQSDNSGAATGIGESVYVASPSALGFPTFVLIDKNFLVQYVQGGYSASQVQAKVVELLAQ